MSRRQGLLVVRIVLIVLLKGKIIVGWISIKVFVATGEILPVSKLPINTTLRTCAPKLPTTITKRACTPARQLKDVQPKVQKWLSTVLTKPTQSQTPGAGFSTNPSIFADIGFRRTSPDLTSSWTSQIFPDSPVCKWWSFPRTNSNILCKLSK